MLSKFEFSMVLPLTSLLVTIVALPLGSIIIFSLASTSSLHVQGSCCKLDSILLFSSAAFAEVPLLLEDCCLPFSLLRDASGGLPVAKEEVMATAAMPKAVLVAFLLICGVGVPSDPGFLANACKSLCRSRSLSAAFLLKDQAE